MMMYIPVKVNFDDEKEIVKPIERFLGINENTSGDTQLQLGESPSMLNFRLTENFKLRKREGYSQLFASLGAFNIRGMWYGKINGSYHYLFTADGVLYEHDLQSGLNTNLGSLTDNNTFFFAYNNKVYMLNGSEYKYWDGTTFGDVAGYVPLVATETPPAGGGTPDESINQLTGKKHQWFSPDGVETEFHLAETDLLSVDSVYVDGVLKTLATDYTVDLVTGKVTFTVAPVGGTPDSVDIQWDKANNDRSVITGNLFAMFFGGKNDTRVFLYANGTNKYYFSDLADGVPSAEYFPVNNYREIGSDEFQVTDIVRQYDRQNIYSDNPDTWYSYYDPITVDGVTIPDFPTYPLNQTKGNVAPGQTRLINNNPLTIQDGVYQWISTNVRDERNVEYISNRVQPSLDTLDLTTALTVDWESKSEYWLAVGNQVWIYNYRLDVWYRFTLYDSITSFLLIDDELYFGTTNGQIMKFDESVRNDNGNAITTSWEMGFYDFEAEYLTKFLNELWISLKPEDRSSLDVYFQTDKDPKTFIKTIKYNLATFVNANFGSWSFSTSYNPQPFHLKTKAKKFVYFKLILENSTLDEKVTLLSINLPARYGGKSR